MIYGIAFSVIGVAGFIPGLVQPAVAPDTLAVDAGYGHLFGLFPVNVPHNLVHLLFGIWGPVAYPSVSGAIRYAQGVAIIYAVLMVMGFFPLLRVTFGLVPLYGHDIWLHAVLALVAAYFGWMHRDRTSLRTA